MTRTALAVGTALAVLTGCDSGVTVRVANHGTEAHSDLAVVVTGQRRALPKLDVGESASVVVEPTGESAITLVDGVDTLTSFGYVEPGYRGSVAFRVGGDTAVVTADHIVLY